MKHARAVVVTVAGLVLVAVGAVLSGGTGAQEGTYTETFALDQCNFSSTGSNPYFVLQPGHQLVLAGKEHGKEAQLTITVLNETKQIAGVETRVVEERETQDGKLAEVSRNYFAMCQRTNSVFYFGESVDIYKGGRVASHEGSWEAGEHGARAGLMMPGIVLLGARYYQEIAPGTAMDQAEIRSLTKTLQTPAGGFRNCLEVGESTPLEPGPMEFKFYAPGVGLVKYGLLELVSLPR